jgi:DUF4097 and DUF4098 domain-containing protein YvlB
MHKASIALIVSGVLLVLGISVVLAGLRMGGSMNFSANPLTQTVETVGEDNVQGQGTVDAFDKIHLEFDVGNVTIEEGSDYYVEYDLPKREVPEISVENGTLKITQKPHTNVIFGFMMGKSPKRMLRITVPEGTKLDRLEADQDVGNLIITLPAVEDLDVHHDTGNVEISGLEADDFKVKSDTGNTTLTDCRAKDAELISNTGSIKMDQCVMTKLLVDVDTGDCKFERLETEQVKFDVDTGDAEGSMVGSRDDYSMILDVDTGKIRIGDDTYKDNVTIKGSGDKKIEADVDTGDLELVFVD